MKFTKQEVIQAVRRVLEEKQSIQSSAKSIGMSKTLLLSYVQRAREHGYGCLDRPTNIKKYSGDFKIQVVEYGRKNQLSCNATAAHFNLARSTVQKWERIYLEEGASALSEDHRGQYTMSNKKIGRPPKLEKQVEEDIIAENQRLRMENEFLKKLNALVREREEQENKK